MKLSLLFSGQAAQYSGMGKDLYHNFEIVKNCFDEADSILGFSIKDICFKEELNEMLNDTTYTQVAIFTLSTAIYRLFNSYNFKEEYLAGLSLGEYTALHIADAFSFEDGLKLVKKRGELMANSTNKNTAMTAILGLENEVIEEIVVNSSQKGYITIANYNAPGQLILSGELEAIKEAEILSDKAGAKTVRLNLSAAFHSKLMSNAQEKLALELEKTKINKLSKKIISNVNAKKIEDSSKVKDLLIKQIVSPVRWEESMRYMINQGVDTFVELGPGKTLVQFIKRIDKSKNRFHIEDLKTLDKTLNALAKL